MDGCAAALRMGSQGATARVQLSLPGGQLWPKRTGSTRHRRQLAPAQRRNRMECVRHDVSEVFPIWRGFCRAAGRGACRGAGHDQGRRPAFALGYDGHFRDDAEGHDGDADRRSERQGRTARSATGSGGGGPRVRLAAVRRKGPRTDHHFERRRDLLLLDEREPQVDPAGGRGTERAGVLPGAVRGRGILAQRVLHGRRAEPAGDPRDRLLPRRTGRREVRASGHRLCLPADHQQHPRGLPDLQRHPRRGHLRQLHALRPFRLVQDRVRRRGAGC
jgi:hypothetical protein